MISVLLVDDEEALLDITKTFLEETNAIKVTPVLSAFEALDLLESTTFDAIVSDFEMPLMNGIDFLKSVKSRGNETPFIIFTGRGREYVAIDALNNGATFYLQKGSEVIVQYAELRNMIFQAVQRRQSEQALLTSEERYRAVVESQVELICRFRPDGTYLVVNGAFCRYYGKTVDELVGHRYRPKSFPQDRFLISRHLSSLTPENPTATMEHRIICPRHGTRWQQWSDTAIFGEHGEVTEYQSVGRDITEWKRTAEQLHESRIRLNSIVQGSPIPQFAIDSTHRVIYWNAALEELSGIKAGEMIGTTLQWKAFYPEERPCMADLLVDNEPDKIPQWYEGKYAKSKLIEGGYEATDFFRHIGPAGTWLYFTVAPIRNSEGQVIGVVETLEDITERKRAEKVLTEANKKLYLLNTITRHDVLNQLTAISSILQLVQHQNISRNINETLAQAENSVDVIERQIAFMSDYQDIDVHTPRWQDPTRILANVRVALPLDTIRLESDLGKIEIYADPLLEKVFLNLVDNSVRHGGGVTRVRFYSQKSKGDLLIFCKDNGKGIVPDEKERIFGLGYGRHTGFGLYLAREILSITGITLDEVGVPGQGALFRMRVPQNGFRMEQERLT